MSNATFVNVPPTSNPPPTLNLVSGRQLLFPFMNFTCNGTITRLTFLGWLGESGGRQQSDITTRLTLWPHFSLWRPRQDQYPEETEQIGPESPRQYRINATYQLAMVEVTINTRFYANDILGVTLLDRGDSTTESGISMAILTESRDYGKTLYCYYTDRGQREHISCNEDSSRERPYIAIEIGELTL